VIPSSRTLRKRSAWAGLLRGTHTGDFFGQPPTGAPFEARGLDMVRVRDGQLVEHWAFAGSMRPR
jgi:SnoaL-like polyketide cyclase